MLIKKVLIVFGTRPEAIKMCPLVLELKKRESIKLVVCVTGQHKEMLQQVLDVFQVEPDYNLEVMQSGQTLFDITRKVMEGMKTILEKEKPDLVLVHGDTSTTYASAVSAFYLQIPVGHVEAGLRTYNIYSPYPEEFNRQAVSIIARYNFAPTETARSNLLREGRKENSVFVTGNTAIDALKTTVKRDYKDEITEWAFGSKLIVLTAHRRENLGQPLRNIFSALKRVVEEHDDVKVIYPVHLNPIVQETARDILGNNIRIRLVDPIDVLDFHNILAKSYMVLTDSGGIQEEAPSLGKPVLVVRDTTERPEGVEAGTLKLIGTEEENVYRSITELLTDFDEYEKMSKASNPYGDGKACIRIADIICKELFTNE